MIKEEYTTKHPDTPLMSDEYRGALSRGIAGRIITEKHRHNLSIAVARRTITEEMRAAFRRRVYPPEKFKRHSEMMRGRTLTEVHKQNITNGLRKFWDNLTDDEWKEYLGKCMKKSAKSPNKSEEAILTYISPLGFEFIGGGSDVLVPGTLKRYHKPDFLHREKNIIVEFDGRAGHDPFFSHIPDNKRELDIHRNMDYVNAGFTLVVLFPPDLMKGEEHICSLVLNKKQDVTETYVDVVGE